jgi:hypothetical protein
MKEHPAIDLVLSVLRIQASHLLQQSLDFVFGVARQLVLGKDRRRRVGDREDRDDVEIAVAGMKFTAAMPARRSFGFGLVGLVGLEGHGLGLASRFVSGLIVVHFGLSVKGGLPNRGDGVRSPGDGWTLFVTMSLETMGLNKPCRFLESIGEKADGQFPAMADRAMV